MEGQYNAQTAGGAEGGVPMMVIQPTPHPQPQYAQPMGQQQQAQYAQPIQPAGQVMMGGNVIVGNQAGVVVPAGMPDGQLQDFTLLPGVVVKQRKKNWCIEMCCMETQSEYRIASTNGGQHYNQWGPDIMYAHEESDFCCRLCCGTQRSASVKIHRGAEKGGGPLVSRYERPFRCQAGCCCCQQKMFAWDSQNTALGFSQIPFFCCFPSLDVKNAQGEVQWKVAAQCCPCGVVTFDIVRPGGKDPRGFIRKEWGGLAKECCTDADTFSVVFPPEADGKERANLIGATFLIDYCFFENQKNNNNHHNF